ncbi:MAG: acylneuraminate cytidylyltransferase, partial [Anaerolineales bacterium]
MVQVTSGGVLALIPARGGSKSIPRKNILQFAGHPLLAYSIAAAQQAERVTRVIVSTDDEEIAKISRRYGAEVPFLRPAVYAEDGTPDLPVFIHALSWLAEKENYHPEVVVHLRPTTPVRPPGVVDEGVNLLIDHPRADAVRAVVPSGQNPFKMWQIDEEGRLKNLLPVEGLAEPYNAPRQNLPQTYWQTGHVDITRPATLLEKKSMTGEVILPLVLDPRYTVDIDTQRDWEQAEWLIQSGDFPVVRPEKRAYNLPEKLDLVVFDFDGVFTDNRVWVSQEGVEQVAAHRGDGMGISLLQKAGFRAFVLSTETNPVVAARCQKMSLPVYQGVAQKGEVLKSLLAEQGVSGENVIFVGNDVNDLPCFSLVGCGVAVADAHPTVLEEADLVLKTRGGHGAVREMCDLILN